MTFRSTTQLPYALTAAAVSFITYVIAGFIHNAVISLIVGIALMVGTVLILKKFLPTPDSASLQKETQKPAKG